MTQERAYLNANGFGQDTQGSEERRLLSMYFSICQKHPEGLTFFKSLQKELAKIHREKRYLQLNFS